VSIWRSVQSSQKSLLHFNHWPNPVSWIFNIDVLICNQDTWLALIELETALTLDWFWTNVVPSPRELERKALLGGYRCGFYIDVKVKSPAEVVFGKDSTLLIVEIAKPFVTGLFWLWAVAGTLEAITYTETLIYPFLFCVPEKGICLTANGTAPIGQGHITGTTAFPTIMYDPFGICSPLSNVFTHGIGDYDITFTWFIESGTVPLDNVKTGWTIDGFNQIKTVVGHMDTGQEHAGVDRFTGTFTQAGAFSPYFEADSGPRVIPASATNVRCIITKCPH